MDDKLRHEDYKNVFFNGSHIRHEMNRIQSRDLSIGLYRSNKIYLPFYKNKKIYT